MSCAASGAKPSPADAVPVLWHEPSAPDASPALEPKPPYRFLAEDMSGDSPKFNVVDAAGLEWRVKLGPESQTETAAARLLNGAGYFVEHVRYLPSVRIDGLPQLKRGQQFVGEDNTVRSVRLEARPKTVDRLGTWDFAANPFVGTAELDGLKVLMVLINNYDARTQNNQVLLTSNAERREARYVVADLGASFGRYGGLGGTRTKNDLEGYRASQFISHVTDGTVHFAYTTRPQGFGLTMFVLNPVYVAGELKKQRDMRTVPVTSARWIAKQLARLDDEGLRGAFDAAGYDSRTGAEFARILRERIRQLAAL